jgi:hypothetical protein
VKLSPRKKQLRTNPKKKYNGQQRKKWTEINPIRCQMKKHSPFSDKTTNRCIGGCWFALAQTKYLIIISLSYNLVEHYSFTFLQKESSKKC